jgi:hypothetical protein
MDRASDYGSEGWGFESLRARKGHEAVRAEGDVRILQSRMFGALAGVVGWSATEYALHRVALHERRGPTAASAKHFDHHADMASFAPIPRKIAAAAATAAVMYPLTARPTTRRWAGAFTTGFIGTYFGYEIAHRRIHAAAPRTRYGRWARRHHLHHHFGAPQANFGVTTPIGDVLFGSREVPTVVSVPRRKAPAWLLDASGSVRPEFAADYQLRAQRYSYIAL